jgi:diaminopimelate epimerase
MPLSTLVHIEQRDAPRAVCSKLGIFDPGERIVMRSPGGVSRAWLRIVNGQWLPSLEGNATFVYRTMIDPSVLLKVPPRRDK